MSSNPLPFPEERRAELTNLAHQIASQVAWSMALEDQARSEAGVREFERETLAELLSAERAKPAPLSI